MILQEAHSPPWVIAKYAYDSKEAKFLCSTTSFSLMIIHIWLAFFRLSWRSPPSVMAEIRLWHTRRSLCSRLEMSGSWERSIGSGVDWTDRVGMVFFNVSGISFMSESSRTEMLWSFPAVRNLLAKTELKVAIMAYIVLTIWLKTMLILILCEELLYLTLAEPLSPLDSSSWLQRRADQ